MRFNNVSILSVEHVDAPHEVTSQEIEARLAPTMQRLGIQDNLIRDVSGIKSRRWWSNGTKPSDGATTAGELAIEAAGIERERLGILINTSVCRDFVEPSTACIVHHKLRLPEGCMNYDVTNACLGFINGMDLVGNMIERGQVDYGILVDSETSRLATESTIERLLADDVDGSTFRENFATLTLGSGAAAMVLGRSDQASNGHRYLGGVNLADTRHWRVCTAERLDQMSTDTKTLTKAGLALAIRTWQKAVDELGWTVDTHDCYAQHQVSKAHSEKLAEIIGLDLGKVYKLYPTYGNVGPAGIAIVLSRIAKENHLSPGAKVAMMGIGSGINCTMAEILW